MDVFYNQDQPVKIVKLCSIIGPVWGMKPTTRIFPLNRINAGALARSLPVLKLIVKRNLLELMENYRSCRTTPKQRLL